MQPLVYLGGPISSLTHDGADEWRVKVASDIDHFARALNPMRFNANLKDKGVLGQFGYEDSVFTTDRAITQRDRWDVQRSAVVFFNFLGCTRPSIGSCVEVGWADSKRIPIIIVMEDDNMHQHGIINTCAGYIVPTLEEGVECLRGIL